MNIDDALRRAGDTIGQTPSEALREKLARFKAEYATRDQREIMRQQEELNAIELDEAAYRAGVKSEKEGDLREAARWYQAAASSDFPGASARLAKVLSALVSKSYAGLENLTASEAELVTRTMHWYVTAFAAGESGDEIEPDDPVDDLIPRHDLFRERPRAPTPPLRAASLRADQAEDGGECPIGGLRNVFTLDEDARHSHCESCQPCQFELHALLPDIVPRPRPRISPRT